MRNKISALQKFLILHLRKHLLGKINIIRVKFDDLKYYTGMSKEIDPETYQRCMYFFLFFRVYIFISSSSSISFASGSC